MAAPDYVPVPSGRPKYYESPPSRPGGWRATRPGETFGGPAQIAGGGHQGPDQGYALKLLSRFEGQVSLRSGENWSDVAAGAAVIALKRASMLGRAPVRADAEIALTMWGYLDDSPPAELVGLRRESFMGLSSPHHYLASRRLAEAVPEGSLRASALHVFQSYNSDWTLQLDLDVLAPEDSGDRTPADH